MIRLSRSREPRTIALGFGVTVTLKPLSFAVYRAAMHSAERRAREMAAEIGLIDAAGGTVHDIPAPHDRDGMRGLRDQFLLQALARHAITDWDGVGDDDGAPAAPTPDAIDALIRGHPLLAERFELEYLRDITELVAEGNASGAAPNGTSAAAPATAATVAPQAPPAATGDAAEPSGRPKARAVGWPLLPLRRGRSREPRRRHRLGDGERGRRAMAARRYRRHDRRPRSRRLPAATVGGGGWRGTRCGG